MVNIVPEFFNVVMLNAGAIESPRIIAPEVMQGKRYFHDLFHFLHPELLLFHRILQNCT
jgi:hypothetical protein